MRREIVLLIGALFIGSCSSHFSGNIVQQDIAGARGTVPARGGSVPYRNDATASARRDDALKKIAKFCGADSYTVTHEGSSSTSSDMSEVDFRCGGAPAAPAPQKTSAIPANAGTSTGSSTTRNPNVTPADFDHP